MRLEQKKKKKRRNGKERVGDEKKEHVVKHLGHTILNLWFSSPLISME